MKNNKLKFIALIFFALFFFNEINAQSSQITYFPKGPSYYYEQDGLEIKSFRSCGTYVYGPEACYRVRNKNTYTVLFRVKYLLKNGNWIKGQEHRIEAGGIEDFREYGGCSYCSGVADIKIDYVQ